MVTPPNLHLMATESSLVDAGWSAGRALFVAVALTSAAAGLGFGVSWLSESESVAPESDASPTLLAYLPSSARVSGDLGAP